MRSVFALLVLFFLPGLARAGDPAFTRVWPQWHNAESFDRISEFFGGAENSGRQVVRRTHAADRAGFYFLVRLNDAAALAGAKFVVNVIRPDAPDPKEFAFPAEARAGSAVFLLGLTGVDWPGGEKAHAVAWKLTLVAADGHTLAEQKSFLWEKPAK